MEVSNAVASCVDEAKQYVQKQTVVETDVQFAISEEMIKWFR